jgi:2-dehydropantoate 2-reductase
VSAEAGTMEALIYGGGAVGLGLASCLLASRVRVGLVARPATVDALRTEGLTREGLFGTFHAPPQAFEAFATLAEGPHRSYDFVLVCTKSYDSQGAAEDLAAWGGLGEQARLVLCQNGWGNAERFVPFFRRDRLYNARIITGFTRPRPNAVTITVHADAIHMGSLFGSPVKVLEPLCEAISSGGIPCEPTETIERDLWAKMLYNCALNGLGAILDVPYGRLAEAQSSRRIMDAVIDEVYTIMRAAGYTTHWTDPTPFKQVFYERLVPDTAAHLPSTLQDIRARKRTEIDALNGAVLGLADRHGLKAPFNEAIWNLVRFIESSYRP